MQQGPADGIVDPAAESISGIADQKPRKENVLLVDNNKHWTYIAYLTTHHIIQYGICSARYLQLKLTGLELESWGIY